MEIERKFLITTLPEDLAQYPKCRIEQSYLCTQPVLRIRRKDEQYFLTYKGPGLLAREEHEFPLTEEAYCHLRKKADGNQIVKDRYEIPCGDYMIELDIFDAPFAPMVLAEVEFPSEEEALEFPVPEWFGEEVTYNPEYTNAAMSERNLGKEGL